MGLVTVATGGGPQVVNLANGGRIINGNFQGYAKGQYAAWTGMWGHYLAQNDTLQATSSMRVQPAYFPAATRFTWDVTPDPDWTGVNGFLHVSYGNYDDSPGTITPRQVQSITDLTVDIDWTFTGDNGSGLLAECWLSPVATPSGSPGRLHEIGFFPKTSPTAAAWLSGLPAVGAGSFVDSNGVTWNVRAENTYYVAYPPGYGEFRGVLPFDDYLAFLLAAGKIGATEWFNGLAFGVEPHHGAGSLTIDRFTPTYA